jgi:tetratricopeptide (TPR) repeat protein
LVTKILEKDPNNPHALNFLGYSFLEKKENMEKAFEYISKAVKLKPDDGYIRDSLAWYYFTVGKYQDALKEAKKAFELVKSDVIISKHLAKIYESLKNYEKAKEFYAEALKNAKVQNEREDVLKQINELEKNRLPASESK